MMFCRPTLFLILFLSLVKTPCFAAITTAEAFLVILVDARHLDYSDGRNLLKTIAKHPSDGSKNGDVGHAWVYVEGMLNGQRVYVEGGHSGERGILKAKYCDGVMNYIEYGVANPTPEQRQNPCLEPNPIKYLWESQPDGFFEEGTGGHTPTFAAAIALTDRQFRDILDFIVTYNYQEYSLTGNQCSSFVTQIAALAYFSLDSSIAVPIEKSLYVDGEWLFLWEDPVYSTLIIASPDILEDSLKRAVAEGRAQEALRWYRCYHHQSKPLATKLREFLKTIYLAPQRLERWLRLSL